MSLRLIPILPGGFLGSIEYREDARWLILTGLANPSEGMSSEVNGIVEDHSDRFSYMDFRLSRTGIKLDD